MEHATSTESLTEIQDALADLTETLEDMAKREDSFVLGQAVRMLKGAITLIHRVLEMRAT